MAPAADLRSRTSKPSDEQQSSPQQNAPTPPKKQSIAKRATTQILTKTANLANILPTGTLLAFQILTPIFSSNGACEYSTTKIMTLALLLLLGLSCFLASFTDSVKSTTDDQVYYGITTMSGLSLFDCPDPEDSGLPDLSKYKMRFVDFVHGVLSVLMFVDVALRDKNVTKCFLQKPNPAIQHVLDTVPLGISLVCGLLFMVFPTTRHGIGYPVAN